MPVEDLASQCIDADTALGFAQGRLPPDVVARVDEHVDGCNDCRLVLLEAVKSLREGATAPAQMRPGSLTRVGPGALLAGRYRIVRFIARGGMGEVYEAEDQMLDARIALKTVASAISDDARAIERLKVEASFARRVTDPHVCRIFDVGVHQDGDASREPIFFITMELVPGESLGERIRKSGPLDTETALPLVRGMVAALGAAHAVGVVHRDFKCDNVMLATRTPDSSPRAVVMDFGLARTASGWSSARLSDGKGLVGTVAYMAPEQVEGGAVSAATDIYALGVVMFEMVTGQLPFGGDTIIEAATKRLSADPPSPRTLVPALDPRWDDAILRCLERAPADRFARAEEVLATLTAPPGAAPARRSRRPALIAVVAAMVAAAGVVLVRSRADRPAAPSHTDVEIAGPPAPVPPPPAVRPPPPPSPAAEAPVPAPKAPTLVRRKRAKAVAATPPPPEDRASLVESPEPPPVEPATTVAPPPAPPPAASPKPAPPAPKRRPRTDGLIFE